jgi:acyl-coenzyme A thioesterase PaaI-like protein
VPFPAGATPASNGDDEPLNRLAAAIRRIGAVAVGRPLDDARVGAAADQLAELADAFEAAAPVERRPRLQPNLSGHPQDYFPTSPMIGFANPVAPPVEVWGIETAEGRREIRGRVTFGYPYEGPPTCVHGGIIAALFDELLGAANVIAGKAAMTGTLTVRYRRPTPLLTPLDLEARCTGSRGRKVFTWGGIFHDGHVTAEVDGIFVELQPRRMLDIVTANAQGATAPVIDPSFARVIAENARRD